MVQLLILIILGVIAISLAYFFFGEIPLFTKMTIVAGGFLAALVAVLLQWVQPVYMALLGLVAAALLVSLIYMKRQEKEQQQRLLEKEQRRASRVQAPAATQPERGTIPVSDAPTDEEQPKFAGMESIDPKRKEQ